jgi:hypothetical protein
VSVKSIVTVPTAKAYNGRPNNSRIHSVLPSPMSVRVYMQTDTGQGSSIHYSYQNPPIDVDTVEGMVARMEANEKFLLFSSCDDVESLERHVATLSKTPEYYVVRIGSSSAYVYQSTLDKAAFKAKLEGKKDTELDVGNSAIKVYGLVDTDVPCVYALNFALTTETSYASDYVLLPGLGGDDEASSSSK